MSRVSRRVRDQVRERAGRRCEYCRKPEGISVYSHQVEHIIAVKHRGSSEVDNLAWACFQCNSTKGSDIASIDHITGVLTPLYNPRSDRWDEHFVLEGAELMGKTAVGRVTIHILQLNHPDQLETRGYLLRLGRW